MSYDLKNKLDKQAHQIELLEEELRAANLALEEKNEFAAGLELDLEHAIQQLRDSFLDTQKAPLYFTAE